MLSLANCYGLNTEIGQDPAGNFSRARQPNEFFGSSSKITACRAFTERPLSSSIG
jgi:hypothetical protein